MCFLPCLGLIVRAADTVPLSDGAVNTLTFLYPRGLFMSNLIFLFSQNRENRTQIEGARKLAIEIKANPAQARGAKMRVFKNCMGCSVTSLNATLRAMKGSVMAMPISVPNQARRNKILLLSQELGGIKNSSALMSQSCLNFFLSISGVISDSVNLRLVFASMDYFSMIVIAAMNRYYTFFL